MTHKQAVRRIAAWLRNSKGCTVVIAELKTTAGETPDVIGWRYGGQSMLIECKVSRADFFADRDKFYRRDEDSGMGDLRYFAVPKGLVKPDELADGWGLLEISEYFVKEVKPAVGKECHKRHEVVMLMSAMRRLEISTAVFVERSDSDALCESNVKNL